VPVLECWIGLDRVVAGSAVDLWIGGASTASIFVHRHHRQELIGPESADNTVVFRARRAGRRSTAADDGVSAAAAIHGRGEEMPKGSPLVFLRRPEPRFS